MSSDLLNFGKFDTRDFVIEDRYPKRNRKNKIENLGALEEPEYINKAEKLTTLPYDIDEILTTPAYEHSNVVREIPIEEFTLEYIKRTGLDTPLFFNVPPADLGMRMPDPENFTVDNVLECVGGNRKIEVVEVTEQSGRLMKLHEFIDYFKKGPDERKELLNVLSLEFSSTKLAELVSAPAFVSKIDWIDNVWPKELFARQKNLLEKSNWAKEQDFSTYPKVQRYCLMSVARCFTDYHIDFGGTSVWYHILKGEKVFWLIEPTEENLKLYEEWILGGANNSSFFGQIVHKCTRIHLKQGNTLIIPSGWIHCVYTPVDSLVFGGNFLHSFSVPMQIRVSRSEDKIKIGSKYRFPHFKQIFWCYVAKIVQQATGRIYQRPPTEQAFTDSDQPDEKIGDESRSTAEEQPQPNKIDADSSLIFYDEFGNAEDGSYTFNPIQQKFANPADHKDFRPSTEYNLDYLQSLSPYEINGLCSLLPFITRLFHSRQPEVVEGITRPHHLIQEFEALLKQIVSMDLLNIDKLFELSVKPALTSQFVEQYVKRESSEAVSLDMKLYLKKKTGKRPSKGSSTVEQKRVHKNGANNNSSDQPILIDGLPLATMAGIDHSDAIPLGHKPIESAWRKGSQQMLKPPSAVIPKIKVPKEEQNNTTGGETSAADVPPPMQDDDAFSLHTSCFGSDEKVANKRVNKIRCAPRAKTKVSLIEVHDESPEFAHRSPLQQFPVVKRTSQEERNYHGDSSRSSTKEYGGFSRTGQNYPRDQRRYNDDNGRQSWRSNNNYGNGRQSWHSSNNYNNDKWHSQNNNNNRDGNGRQSWHSDNSNRGRQSWRSDNYQRRDSFDGNNRNWNNNNPMESSHFNRGQFDAFTQPGSVSSRNTFDQDWQQSNEDSHGQFHNRNPSSNTSTEFGRQKSPPYSDDEMDMDIEKEEEEQEIVQQHQQQSFRTVPSAQTSYQVEQHHQIHQLPPQSMSMTVNELHQISQIMNNPVPDFFSVDQIPLPPLPKQSQDDAEENIAEDGKHPGMKNSNYDPFNEVDQLSQISQMMQDQH